MPNKVCFIGHHKFLPMWLVEKLKLAVEEAIKNGCQHFNMGTHGDFDDLALAVCRQLKSQYPTIKIEVVLTSPPPPTTSLDDLDNIVHPTLNQDIESVMYDIETLHPKQRIWFSNKKMIESCDTLICYADPNWHFTNGTHKAVKYAQKCGLQIINLANYSLVNSKT